MMTQAGIRSHTAIRLLNLKKISADQAHIDQKIDQSTEWDSPNQHCNIPSIQPTILFLLSHFS